MKRYVSSQRVYDLANLPRIDFFITKLNRDYFANLAGVDNKYLKKNVRFFSKTIFPVQKKFNNVFIK